MFRALKNRAKNGKFVKKGSVIGGYGLLSVLEQEKDEMPRLTSNLAIHTGHTSHFTVGDHSIALLTLTVLTRTVLLLILNVCVATRTTANSADSVAESP